MISSWFAALVLLKPLAHSPSGSGREHGRSIPFSDLRAPTTKNDTADSVLANALRYSYLSNLIIYDLVGFMYFEEAVPAAKCDALANTYL